MLSNIVVDRYDLHHILNHACAAQVEQWATSTNSYHFTSEQYNYQFTLKSGSTSNSVTGFYGKDSSLFSSSVAVSEHANQSSIRYIQLFIRTILPSTL